MNEADIISEICLKIVAPLQDKLNIIAGRLASKDDLQILITSIEHKFQNEISSCLDNFKNELEIRDNKIES